MTARLRCEIFPSDLDATADFYVRVLGFSLHRDERSAPVGYLELRRGGVQLGAAARAEVDDRTARRPPTGVELVLEVDDLDAERARVAAAGWPVEEDVVLRPWGLRDFRVLDPSGYYLRITTGEPQPPDRPAAQRDPDLGAAYAGIAVGGLAVVGATAVALRWLGRRPAVRTVTVGPRGWLSVRSVRPPAGRG
jgi:lactoylglutathione lyase